jgi:hypothetical protein
MVVDPIYVGQDVQVRMTTLDPDGNAAGTASVRFKVKSPTGVTTTYQSGESNVTEITAGTLYGCRFDVDTGGKWFVRCEALDGTSAVVGVDEFSFLVNQSKL